MVHWRVVFLMTRSLAAIWVLATVCLLAAWFLRHTSSEGHTPVPAVDSMLDDLESGLDELLR